ncbi:MAG: HD-GYP domain-containing protein [Actinomycetota bacterium]|nr:HD-GYP domain-containing protein [Actinomycetota bacterium]
MKETPARDFLAELRKAARHLTLYPQGHPIADEAVRGAARVSGALTRAGGGEAVVSIFDDAFYLGSQVLPHASLEFNGLLREMQSRGIESMTLLAPVSAADVADLAAFVAGASGDLPAGGSVRLNERPLSPPELGATDSMSGVRRSYARSLDIMRAIAAATRTGQDFDLSGVSWAVEGLVEQALSQPSASLLLSTVKSHDEYTFYHSVNVCILSLTLGRLTGLEDHHLQPLGVGSLLHDIGKVAVPAATLQHPGRLDHHQWMEVKLHPQDGAETIMAAAGPDQEVASVIAFEHHARFDGSGYPKVSGRKRLHFFSRLVGIADSYDAITTRRSYRRAETPHRALDVLLRGAGSHYDPDLVRAFVHMMGVYPPGSLLQLDSGDVVMVTHDQDGDPRRPATVLVRSASGEMVEPEPYSLEGREVAEQLLPQQVGIEPAALLEQVSI